jgi:cytochrome c oxidase subunit 2
MAFSVVVVEPDAFRAWLEAQSHPAAPPGDSLAAQGLHAFVANGCTACHTVRGTPAAGAIGPDLTHVGSRLRIAAGTLPNDPDTLARWIGHAERFKPGVRMPPFRGVSAGDRFAIAAYLSGLK